MTMKDILNKIMGKEEIQEDLPDDMTRDKYLRSLRRERRTQLEQEEKEMLKQKIADWKRDQVRKNMFGVQEAIKQKKEDLLIKKMQARHQATVLMNTRPILSSSQRISNKRDEFRRKKKSILSDSYRF